MLFNQKNLVDNPSRAFRDYIFTPSGLFIAITNEPMLLKYDANTLEELGSVPIGSFPAVIGLVSEATAVVGYTSGDDITFVDINTLATTTESAAGDVYKTTQNQQIAGYLDTGVVFTTRDTSGTIQKITSSQSVSQITPSEISGDFVICITTTGASGTWLMGTDKGEIHEFDSSGTVLKTITIPTEEQINSGDIDITGISFYDNRLLVENERGIRYLYNYEDSSIIEKGIGFDSPTSISTTSTLSDSASGHCIGSGPRDISIITATQEIYFKNQILVENEYKILSTNEFYNAKLSSDLNKVAVGSNNTSSFETVCIFDISPTRIVPVQTKAQYPAGNLVSARILRIKDSGIGKTCIQLDENIGAEATDLNATESRNYIELATISSGGTKVDIREFQA